MDMCAKTKSKSSTHYAHMYSKTYKCSICGRQGHLAKFCYDAHKHKNSNVPCASHIASSSCTLTHLHAHSHKVHYKHASVFKCDYCGRFGHLAKYCFDLKRKSHLTNASNRPHVFKCDVCGRFGHLAKFCFDIQKASKLQYVPNRPLFKNVSHLQNNFKRKSLFANDSRARANGPQKQMDLFHCTNCNRKGHLNEYCFDHVSAPYVPKRVHNPKALSFNDRGHVPKSFGTKSSWVPKQI